MTDNQINVAIAQSVAGYRNAQGLQTAPDKPVHYWGENDASGPKPIPDYAHDADAVIVLLDREGSWMRARGNTVYIWHPGINSDCEPRFEGHADTFCRAACMALLKAHGVTT
jgi:hypothetical protein